MDRDFFNMTMSDFGVYMLNLNKTCSVPKDSKIKDMYFKEFERFENKRFAKLISWLYKNWAYKSFPAIADFKKAFDNTSEGIKTYQSPPRETPNQTLKSKAFKKVHDGLKMLDKLEIEIAKKKMGGRYHIETPRRITLAYWIPFIKQVMRAGMVYQDRKWLKKAEAKGEYFNPREFYPPEYYK